MPNRPVTPDAFPDEPDYLELDSGGERPVPPMLVEHDGPQPTYPFPASDWIAAEEPTTSDNTPRQLLPANPARRKATLVNTGTVTVRIAPSEGECQASSSSFPLAVGASMDVTHKRAVYVAAATGSTGLVAVHAEFEDGR